MRKSAILLALAATAALGACKKTGEGEMEVQTPTVDVDVGQKTDTVQTPTVDVGTKQDTVIVNRPTVDVDGAGNKKADDQKTGTGTKRP
jgi:hypothetical protein